MSGVSVREVETGEQALPGFDKLIGHTQLLQEFQAHVQVATGDAVEKAFSYAEKLSKDVLQRVKEELAGYARPKTSIMVVEVDKIANKLSKPATDYLPRLLINARLGLNTLLVGPAGCGKTIAAGQVAEALGLAFGHACLTAGASETWLFGRQTPNGFIEATFSKLYREGGVFLADEIDAADPNMLLAINTALANTAMYNPISGETIARHEKFVFVGAANTVGKGGDGVYTGRNRLDAATLDRFVLIAIDYNKEIEERVCPDQELRERLQNARHRLRDLKSQEIISTRALERSYLLKQASIPLHEILASLTMGWPTEVVEQVGLLEKAPQKYKPKMGKKSGVPVIPAGSEEEDIF